LIIRSGVRIPQGAQKAPKSQEIGVLLFVFSINLPNLTYFQILFRNFTVNSLSIKRVSRICWIEIFQEFQFCCSAVSKSEQYFTIKHFEDPDAF
ncbi:MAG: hypothetical protein C4517_02135, partial [Stygiobacter sp.]